VSAARSPDTMSFSRCVMPMMLVIFAVITLHAARLPTNSGTMELEERLTKFHSCLYQAESASHCMHLRPAELDTHVDDDDLGELGEEHSDDDDDDAG
jgi:hypothetical protein